MGMVFGKITVETPKYEVLHSYPEYEIRKYAPSVVAQVTYNPSDLRGNRDGGFLILARYIGAFGQPQNTRPEKIAMTAPVVSQSVQPEKIAMTAPVITGGEGKVTMQFILPSKYTKKEEAPMPVDERVVIREEGERKYAVVRFSGTPRDEVVEEKARKLREWLERDGHRATAEFLLARYNDPWTIPFLKTSEVMIPVA